MSLVLLMIACDSAGSDEDDSDGDGYDGDEQNHNVGHSSQHEKAN